MVYEALAAEKQSRQEAEDALVSAQTIRQKLEDALAEANKRLEQATQVNAKAGTSVVYHFQ